MTAEFLTAAGLTSQAGFFTRRGGVSQGPYASLNCSLSGGDNGDHVGRNRALVTDAMHIGADRLVGVTQVHGCGVVHVTKPWIAGQGPKADAMVTDHPDIALGIITADCAPVLLWDGYNNIAGAAHAGWRGAASGVLEATVAEMRRLGSDPAYLTAVVGPCIAQASYEVGSDLLETILPTIDDASRFFLPSRREQHWMFDLAGYCLARLSLAGVRGSTLGVDTCANEAWFFSHRRRTLAGGGPIGHQISVVCTYD